MKTLTMLMLLLAAGVPAASGPSAPKFKVKDLQGKEWTQKTKGYLLVDFWASWCLPCIKEIPSLNVLRDKYHTIGKMEVLGLSVDEGGLPVVRAAVARHKIAYPVALADTKIADSFGVQGFPTAVLLKDGKLIKVFSGERSLAGFEKDLAPYLAN